MKTQTDKTSPRLTTETQIADAKDAVIEAAKKLKGKVREFGQIEGSAELLSAIEQLKQIEHQKEKA